MREIRKYSDNMRVYREAKSISGGEKIGK